MNVLSRKEATQACFTEYGKTLVSPSPLTRTKTRHANTGKVFLRHRRKRRSKKNRRSKLPSIVSIAGLPQAAEQRIHRGK